MRAYIKTQWIRVTIAIFIGNGIIAIGLPHQVTFPWTGIAIGLSCGICEFCRKESQ